MEQAVRLQAIPQDKYSDFRYKVIFNCYKWDPQVGDINTISDHVAILKPSAAKKLSSWAEALARETVEMEEVLIKKPELHGALGLPRSIRKVLGLAASYKSKDHVRLMRFDFHPTVDGWAISEVNSDVPGGFAEASLFPPQAASIIDRTSSYGNLGESVVKAFLELGSTGGKLAFVHATSYSDDRQVMEFLSQQFVSQGFETLPVAPDHIIWKDGKPWSILEGYEGRVDGLIRFFPGEWLPNLPKPSGWQGYFSTNITSCNHPMAILAQSKRLPLIWDRLGIDISTWKKLLPETKDPKLVDWKKDDWILKPAFGRVGEDVSIREVITKKEWLSIAWNASLHPKDWVAQKRFKSLPLQTTVGEKHLCIGVFTVQGKFAGFYGRISSYPRIDAGAQDIAILVSDKEES